MDDKDLKLKRIELYEKKLQLKRCLPHLYGFKMYRWQHEYMYDYDYKMYFLVAANQVGKSSIQIRKLLDIATKPDLWPRLWPETFRVEPSTRPMGWYMYPSLQIATDEFKEKWEKTLLPSGEYKESKQYGWKAVMKDKKIYAIEFFTGFTIYFKAYSQNVHDLQAGTVYYIGADEELPVDIFPELQARLFGTQGIFSMAFTATRGQELWRKAVERVGYDDEKFPDAWKRQVSLYDCQEYHDGTTNTKWTDNAIERTIGLCTTEAEVKRRVYGRFVRSDGLKYPHFNRSKHLVDKPDKLGNKLIYDGWDIYTGIDYGSGGDNHPSAIVFIAVNKLLTKIRLFKCKRFDDQETTQADLYREYCEMRGNMKPVVESFDWAAKDFGTMAERAGENFEKAIKDHAIGEAALNAAFKSKVLKFYDDGVEVPKLCEELENMDNTTDKRKCKDDLIDALRYAIMPIPIDWKQILNIRISMKEHERKLNRKRNDPYENYKEARPFSLAAQGYYDQEEAAEEFDFWNDLY